MVPTAFIAIVAIITLEHILGELNKTGELSNYMNCIILRPSKDGNVGSYGKQSSEHGSWQVGRE